MSTNRRSLITPVGLGACLFPLIDIFANTLLFFMANNPVFNRQEIELPHWDHAPAGTRQRTPQKGHVLGIRNDGHFLWDGAEISSDEVDDRLRQARRDGKQVAFEAERNPFLEAYSMYHQAGFDKPVAIEVQARKDLPAPPTEQDATASSVATAQRR